MGDEDGDGSGPLGQLAGGAMRPDSEVSPSVLGPVRRGSPRVVLVRQPGHVGVEGANPPLSYGVRFVEIAGRYRQVANDDDGAWTGFNDDHL